MATQSYPNLVVNAYQASGNAWYNTGIDLTVGDYFTVRATGGVRPWQPQYGDLGYVGPDGYSYDRWPDTHLTLYSGQRFMALIGGIGTSSTPPSSGLFRLGSSRSLQAPATGRLWLITNDVPNAFGDNAGTFTVTVDVRRSGPTEPPNQGSCDAHGYTPPYSIHPINLRNAEKVLTENDLSVQTPAGSLAFTRIYRQHQQANPDFQDILGSGWVHNHVFGFTLAGSSGSRTATVLWSDGSLLRLEEVSSGIFNAQRGSTVTLEEDGISGDMTLTLPDYTTYVFRLNGAVWQLEERHWPSGEVWTYTYDGNGNLSNVSDGYGRILQFSYIDNSAFDEGLLWRVGDHTASGLSGGSPSGRYVEFTYTQERSNGSVVTNARALLASVQDVRGHTWTYDYYGQTSGESDAEQLNLLTEIGSPTVDTTGDGSADGSLMMQHLTYTFDSDPVELVVNGGMENDSDWTDIADAEPTTNERSTTQVDTGTYSRHVVTANAGEGMEGAAWALFKDRRYTITARVYPVSGQVQMQVPATDVFTQTSSGTGAWQTLSVSDEVADTSDDLARLQFVAVGGAAEFYVDTVSITEENPFPVSIVQELGLQASDPALLTKTFVFQPDRAGVTTETTAGQVTTHYFENGVYYGTADADDHLPFQTLGEDYRPLGQTDANGNTKLLSWSADGRRLDKVVDALNHETVFYYTTAEVLHRSVDAAGNRTLYVYEDPDQPRLPTQILVTPDVNLVSNGEMEADNTGMTDPHWRNISGAAPSTSERSATHVDTGSYAWRVVTTASPSNQGIESRAWDVVTDRVYVLIARVYPLSGAAVRMQVVVGGSPVLTATSIGSGEWETLVGVYTATSDTQARLRFVSDGGAAEFWVDSVYGLDSTLMAQWQVLSYNAAGQPLTEQTLDATDGSTVITQVTRTYYTSGNGEGLLESVTQEEIGGSNDVTTTYFYDSAGRVVQTNQNSNFGSCTRSYTVYDAAGHVVASLCNYENSGAAPTTAAEAVALYDPDFPDLNRVTTHEYDSLGRRFSTTLNAGSAEEQVNLTVYDALNRVVRTISNYVADENITDPFVAARELFSNGVDNTQNLMTETTYNARGLVVRQVDLPGNATLYGYDEAGRQVRVIQNAADPDYDTDTDPDLSAYEPIENSDQDILTTYAHDANSHVVQVVDALGYVHYTVYDALNRVVKTVRSAKDEATLALNPGDTGYDATNDPRSVNYVPSVAPDRDVIERTDYDGMGRVVRTFDALNHATLFGYDALGRQVRVIRNAANSSYNWSTDPDLSAYSLSSNVAEDIVRDTTYASDGRLLYTQDVLGSRTWQAYDGLGRQFKTIVNAQGTDTDGGSGDPRSSSYTPSSEPDEDLIALTHYNSEGQVQWTQDALGRRTWFVYDDLGRRVKTIVNCTYVSGTPAPEDAGYTGSSESDEDLMSWTEYDAFGRVSATIDPRGNETRYSYDILGRRIQTITNYDDGVYDPDFPDQDLIQTTTYRLGGLVDSVVDAAGIETRFEYDYMGRRIKTILNYDDGVYDPDFPDQDVIAEASHDKAGRVEISIDPRGTGTWFQYDAVGRSRKITLAVDTALAVTTFTCFDKAGQVLRVIRHWVPDETWPDDRDEFGEWVFNPTEHGDDNDTNLITVYTLDLLGRVLSVTDPAGNATSTTYAKDGRIVSTTDAASYVTQHRYDELRRLTRIVQAYDSNGVDPALWVWDEGDDRWENGSGAAISHGAGLDRNIIADVTYDKAGRRLSLRDPRGNLTAYEYDLLNRRTRLINPLTHEWTTAYADLGGGGSRITAMDPLTHAMQQDFDRLGRLVSIQYLSESPKLTPDVTFTYDAAGNRILMSESDGVDPVRATTYGYDAVRRLIQVDFDTDGDGNADQTLTYVYDAGGLRTRLELPDGKAVTYTYNARGELTDLALADWETQSTTFSYDHMGRLQSAAQLNGPQTSYHYDEAGHLLDLLHEDGSSNTLAHFEYEVDARGNRIAATETLAQPSSGNLVLEIAYDYDALARLIGADYTMGMDTREHDFTYDLAGNRTQEVVTLNSTPTTTNYTYDIANRLSQIGGQSVDYDNAGRLTDDGTLTYTWDRANRLLDAGGSSYRYNGVGQRVDQTVSSVVTEYLLDGQPGLWQVLAATTGSDVTRFVHGPRGLHLQQQPNTDWVFPLHDGLNSLRSLVDESLDPLHIQNFAPYGSPFGAQGNAQSVFGFTGEPTDQNDLVQLRARYYNPVIGVFPSLDLLEGSIPEGRSLNRYGYVRGNPVNLIDPTGRVGERPGSYSPCRQNDCIDPPTLNTADNRLSEEQTIKPDINNEHFASLGMVFTVGCNASSWEANQISAIAAAAARIGQRLPPGRSFNQVFGELELRSVSKGVSYSANTRGSYLIEWNLQQVNQELQLGLSVGKDFEATAVHELGHVLENRTRNDPYGMMNTALVGTGDILMLPSLADELIANVSSQPRKGRPTGNNDRVVEAIADYFMFWVYTSFTNTSAGKAGKFYMEGGYFLFDQNKGVENPDAYEFPDFLTWLGSGDMPYIFQVISFGISLWTSNTSRSLPNRESL